MEKLSKTVYGSDYEKRLNQFKLELRKKQEELGINLERTYTIVPAENGEVAFQPDDADFETVEIVRQIFHESFNEVI